MEKFGHVYIVTNKHHTVFYTGVTSNLVRRIAEHRSQTSEGFTQKYNIWKLVYYQTFESIEVAILREKQIKGKRREVKIRLIESMNPEWKDLFISLVGFSLTSTLGDSSLRSE